MSVTQRLWIRAGFHSGPLSRHLDRAEAWSKLALIAVFVIVVVPATWYVAQASTEREREQQANRYRVTATLQQTAPFPAGGISSALRTPVTAQWRTAQGALHSGVIRALPGAAAGSTVTIWTDASGNPAPPPITHQDVVAAVFGSAFLIMILTGGVLSGVGALVHHRFERRRFEQWEQEWALVEPNWNRLR